MSFVSPVVVCLFLLLVQSQSQSQPLIWPLPVEYNVDTTTLVTLAFNFNFNANLQNNDILESAFARYKALIFDHTPLSSSSSSANTSTDADTFVVVNTLHVTVHSSSDTLQLGIDESYDLTVSAANASACTLVANTIYGALRGLETFSQLVVYNFEANAYQSHAATVHDYPRFAHRGVLLDCSRHFQTVSSIYRLLDAMAYSKLNTFHWHFTDDQSIPYQSVSYPKFWSAAYSQYERYSQTDIRSIIEYAKYRGIRVLPEFDVPSHASSWCTGYPDVCPYKGLNASCLSPLNPATNLTFELIDGLIREAYAPASQLFFDDFVHLGGDEVNTYCWAHDPSIVQWMDAMGFTVVDANQYFMQSVHDIAAVHQKTTIQWDDVYGMDIAKDTVIEAYYFQNIATIVGAGYHSILSNEDAWYLDHLQTTWQQMYDNEPCAGIADAQTCAEYVLGGELSMWGEKVDDSDVDQTIWPRAAAGAERLWSPRAAVDGNASKAHPRLEYFRCLLNVRGIAAAPTNNNEAREPPSGSSSCYSQRRRR